jgi:hypothetical protein
MWRGYWEGSSCGGAMAARNNDLEKRLARDQEITIRVTGRKSGRTISIPIWFPWEDVKLYLLPNIYFHPSKPHIQILSFSQLYIPIRINGLPRTIAFLTIDK